MFDVYCNITDVVSCQQVSNVAFHSKDQATPQYPQMDIVIRRPFFNWKGEIPLPNAEISTFVVTV